MRIFGCKRAEIIGGWRKPHEVVHNLFSSPNITRMIKQRMMRWPGHVAYLGEKCIHGQSLQHTWERSVYKVITEKHKRKKALGTPRQRWVDNIKMDLKEIG
jgi:hypothetical protein